MPQYSVTRTGGGLPTSDYAIGLDQAFATAESMRNQRRRNQQAANIMKQTMAAKGLAGTVEVDGEGEINAQADEASLKRFFGKDKLDATDTTDNAMLSYIEQRNDFKQKPTFEQTIDHPDIKRMVQSVVDANQGTTDQINQIYNKQLEVMGEGVRPTPKPDPNGTSDPNGAHDPNAAPVIPYADVTQSPEYNDPTLLRKNALSPLRAAMNPPIGYKPPVAVGQSDVQIPMADPNAPVLSNMQKLQQQVSLQKPSDIDGLKSMMAANNVSIDNLPEEEKQALNAKILAMKDLDTQIALEKRKGGGIDNLDGTVSGPINDEAMQRVAKMEEQKKALNEDKDLMSKLENAVKTHGATPQFANFSDIEKMKAQIGTITNPLGLEIPDKNKFPGMQNSLKPVLQPNQSGGTEAASGETTRDTSPISGSTSKKDSSATSESQSYELSASGNTGISKISSIPTVITRSTDGADYQDTMPYSMGTLLAQQGYRDAISAGAGDAVGMQMNPFNAMLKEKMASIGNRNAAAALANKQNVDVKQGKTEIEAGKGEAKLRQGYSSYSNVSMGNSTTKNGGGSQQPEDNDITVGTVVMKKNKDGTITSTDSNISGSEEDVASNAYNNWSKLSEIDKAVIRMNGTDKSSLKNALNKVVGKDIYEKTKSSISGKPVRKVEITIEGNKYQVALNSEGGLVPISGQKLPPHFDQKGHGAMGDYFGMLGDKLRSTPDKLKQLEISYMTDDDEMVGSYSPMSNNAKTSGTFPESFSKAIRRSVQLNQTNKSK